MAVAKQNGDVIPFVKQKDYIMVNNDLGGGSFGKTVLLQDPFIDELFVAKKYEPEYDGIKEQFYKNFLDEIKILYKLNHRRLDCSAFCKIHSRSKWTSWACSSLSRKNANF